MPDDDLLKRLARFERRFFPRYRDEYRRLVAEGQRPRTLFIGCSDSRIVPYVLTGTGPGDLFVVRNVGNLVPAHGAAHGDPAIGAAIEFAVLKLHVRDVVICGHSHCGAIRALYDDPQPDTPHLTRWLDHARDAVLPVTVTEEALRRTEQRSIVLQLERLIGYPAVAGAVARGELFLHGWHYVIEDGRILVFDVESGTFVPTDVAMGEQAPATDPAPDQLQ
ncbi:MAG TPA: carbonic anhydrase [Casimicrobiaceae bacterium]|nr:carbonic anhydrase [Casimicrobiaceae bacterium]